LTFLRDTDGELEVSLAHAVFVFGWRTSFPTKRPKDLGFSGRLLR